MIETVGHALDELQLSFNDPELIPDPYPVYRTLRERAAACQLPMFDGTWLFFRYDDVRALMRDPRLSSDRTSLPLRTLPPAERDEFADMTAVTRRWFGMQDQPAHRPMRQHMNHVIEPLDRAALIARIQPFVDAAVATIRDDGPVDIMRVLCAPLPAFVIGDVLGIPPEDHGQLAAWADDLAFAFGSSQLDIAHVRRAREGVLALDAYMRELAHSDRLSRDGLLWRLVHLRTDGFGWSEAEAYAQAILMLFAGLEPTRYAIGNALYALMHHPEQVAILRRQPDLMASAVEEFLRYGSPVQWVARIARETFAVHEFVIEQGHVVLPYLAAANRDPAQFADPDTLDVTRSPNPHLTFGYGFHHCLGATLVREQMRLVLGALLAAFDRIALDPDAPVRWNSNLGFHGHQSLVLRFGRHDA